MNISALFPLRAPWGLDSPEQTLAHKRLVRFLTTSQSLLIRGSDFHDGEKLSVTARVINKALAKKLSIEPARFESCRVLLEFSGRFEFPGPDIFFYSDPDGVRLETPLDELIASWRQFLPSHLDVSVQAYLFALSLAFAGSIRPASSIWRVDELESEFSRYYVSPIPDALTFLREHGVNSRMNLNPRETVKWVFSQRGVFDGYSDTPASRSLGYLSKLFTSEYREDELSNLVWALAGIESLLVEHGRSSVGQLREKLHALFGKKIKADWLLEMTEQMYGFRSKMIHGGRHLRGAFRTDDEASSKRFYEEYHSELFAVGVLFLLLQETIARRIPRFRFRTVVDSNA